ncbi:MAG: UDP-N-acetylglucosamine--N-acetylmuramyl-(pentapeptide) pyrophosphoryl-undecaprenol [Actinomycetota bacterium]|nr:UDP-N-acetylglucosamine--N-acetylmuramyl-(pentapeptide) pyrophosphoryl-undecaprenol [Actinomycetota bacterium]
MAVEPFRLLVTGGGTGGHTYPALTTLRALQARLVAEGRVVQVLWVGTAGGLEARVAQAEQIAFRAVATGKVRRSRNLLGMVNAENARDMARVPLGVAEARSVVAEFAPDVILSTGGYVAVPVGIAAGLCRCPLVVHEQTVRLGLANRVLVRSASRVAVSSESTLALLPQGVRRRTVVTGNPVRPQVLAGVAQRAVQVLGLSGFDPHLPTVYVTGGAQGAAQINVLVAEVLPWLLERANVVHQCGPSHVDALRERTAGLPEHLAGRYLLTGFVGPELPDLLALADVVLARSGAGTIAELTALGKASVLVPLASSAGNEQEYNARQLERAGAAVALIGQVGAQQLMQALGRVLDGRGVCEEMGVAARALGRPDAAERLVDVLVEAAAREG